MDYIKAEIESKKRALSTLATATVGTGPASKYIKRSDLERQRVELLRAEEDAEQMARAAAKGKGKRGTPVPQREEPESREGEQPGVSTPELVAKSETFNVTAEDAVRRLRAKGQPIRLFGETDKERRLRLRALELIEERTEGQRNEFAKVMEGVQLGLDFEQVSKAGASELVKKTEGEEVLVLPEGEVVDKVQSPKDKEVLVNLMLVKNDPHKVYPQIYHALKRILKEWAQSMHERPDEIKRSTQGKIVAATQQSSAEYLKPLFKSLRNRELAPDVLLAIAEITHNLQIREYLKANDAYLRLSIGNAPWPIGVTMVGIHERAGREKIFSNNVGHVLNDETSRKYIQSLKRLLTFAQTKYPPDDLSQRMG